MIDCIALSVADIYLTQVLERKETLVWYLDWKLWFGLSMWCSTWTNWLIKGYSGSYSWKYSYTAGINFVMLHGIQYYGTMGLGVAMAVLILQCSGTTYLWWKHEDVLKRGGFKCTSVYQDLSMPFLQVGTVFLGQIFLIVFYMSSIFSKLNPHLISYTFWIAAFFCMQMSAFFNRGSDSLLGTTWKTSEWASVYKYANEVEYTVDSFGGRKKACTPGKPELLVRGLMGFVVNNCFRDVLAFTVPILLCQFTDPLNFVVYCVGVNFIVTIDDAQPKDFEARRIGAQGPGPHELFYDTSPSVECSNRGLGPPVTHALQSSSLLSDAEQLQPLTSGQPGGGQGVYTSLA